MRKLFPEPETIDNVKTFVYLASPYWHVAQSIREYRVKRLCLLHYKLISAFPSTFFYNPLTNSNGAEASEDYWRQHGLRMLAASSLMIVLCQPGFEHSVGLKMEIDYAEPRMPIYYLADHLL